MTRQHDTDRRIQHKPHSKPRHLPHPFCQKDGLSNLLHTEEPRQTLLSIRHRAAARHTRDGKGSRQSEEGGAILGRDSSAGVGKGIAEGGDCYGLVFVADGGVVGCARGAAVQVREVEGGEAEEAVEEVGVSEGLEGNVGLPEVGDVLENECV